MMNPLDFLKLLAHDLRWQMLKTLAHSDYRVNELVNVVGQPANLVSYHLKQLRDAGLVTTRRSDADGRDIYYTLELDALRDVFYAAGGAIHPMMGIVPQVDPLASHPLEDQIRVLFICTHNSARSQMAEGLMRDAAGDRLLSFSAGSQPTTIHPEALRTMDTIGIDIREQTVRHLSDYLDQAFDYVITVCDNAREVCPTFKGAGRRLHWGFPDPSAVVDPEERREAFAWTARRLQSRVQSFLKALQMETA